MTDHTHETDCLMCAVRALTEGDPATWNPQVAGETVSGTVLKMGQLSTNFGMVPFVDLWRGGHDRIRIRAYGAVLRNTLESVAPQVGDTLSVWFDGEETVQKGPRAGTTYRSFSANVQRGH
jgi:hypothetical protein